MNNTSNSSWKNKLFLGFWFVLFASLILLINWLFRIPVVNSDDLRLKLSELDNQLTSISALHAKFLLNNDIEDNLFSSEQDNPENEIQSAIIGIKNNIQIIRNNYPVIRKEKLSVSLDELSVAIDDFSAQLQNLVLITHERGNKNSGIVLKWMEISQRMIDAGQSDNNINQKLNLIKQLESEYLLNRKIKTLEEIVLSAEDINNGINPEQSAIHVDDIEQYTVLTGNLLSIEKRMGHNGTSGIIPEMESTLKKLPVIFSGVEQLVYETIEKKNILWTILRYVSIFLIVSLFIHLFVNVFSLIDPLKRIAGFTQSFASGEFPEENFPIGNLPFMQVIKDLLNKHITSLRDKWNFTKDMNQDILDSKLTLAGENDFLGKELIQLQQKILETSKKQAKNEEDNIIRRYMNEGLARFGDILRLQSNDFNLLSDSFIREIVKYLNAIQGGFFVLDDTEKPVPVLKLTSAFAYNRKKYLQQTVALGEGLVGACAKEKQYINLTEIPKGYISITSGLGDTTPDNLLLAPVLHEDELLGVIEIASLQRFKPHEIDFVKEVALSLGSTMVNTRNNQRTSELLAKSQQQALEMAEQEEEMRQNMEELKATQEESNRREDELRSVADAINKGLLVVHYGINGQIIDVNDKMCSFLGIERDKIIGKYHYEIFGGSIKPDAAFWNELIEKGNLTLSETINIGEKSYEFLEHFTHVTNRNHDTVKFLNFATDGRIGNS